VIETSRKKSLSAGKLMRWAKGDTFPQHQEKPLSRKRPVVSFCWRNVNHPAVLEITADDTAHVSEFSRASSTARARIAALISLNGDVPGDADTLFRWTA